MLRIREGLWRRKRRRLPALQTQAYLAAYIVAWSLVPLVAAPT